jgi:hypothetical protein
VDDVFTKVVRYLPFKNQGLHAQIIMQSLVFKHANFPICFFDLAVMERNEEFIIIDTSTFGANRFKKYFPPTPSDIIIISYII